MIMSHDIDAERRDRVCRLGSEAWERLQTEQDWSSYMAMGEAFLVGQQEAFEQSGTNDINNPKYKKAFGAWMVKYNLDRFDRSDRSKLYIVMKNRGLIEAWRSTLPLTTRLKLNHPTSVLRKWQASTQVSDDKSGEPKVSQVAQLKQYIKELQRQHELDEEKLAAADAGSLFDLKKTSADNIAAVIVDNVGVIISASKAKAIAAGILKRLENPKPAG
jgi:hypothetical protein